MKTGMPRPVGRFDLRVIFGALVFVICVPGLALGWLWVADAVIRWVGW